MKKYFIIALLLTSCTTYGTGPEFSNSKIGKGQTVFYRSDKVAGRGGLHLWVNGIRKCEMGIGSYYITNDMGKIHVGAGDATEAYSNKSFGKAASTRFVRLEIKPIPPAFGLVGGYIAGKMREESGSTSGPVNIDLIDPDQAKAELRGLKEQTECR